MKILKILFPLSYRCKTQNSFFASLMIYLGVYILSAFIPVEIVGLIVSVYVFIGGGLLMINYLVKNRDDKNGEE